MAIALIAAAAVTVGLPLPQFLPPDDDGWVVVATALTFIGTTIGDLVGRRMERNVLAKHPGDSGHEQ